MIWDQFLGNLGTFLAALIGLVALWRTLNSSHHQLLLKPLMDRQEHLDNCLDAHATAASDFRAEVREEFRSLSAQVTGLHVTALDKFATKIELEQRNRDLRQEIDLAGRVTHLSQQVAKISK